MSVYTNVSREPVVTEIALPELRWIYLPSALGGWKLQQKWEIETLRFAEPRTIRGVAFEWRDIPVVHE